jgi:hypothetical protein
MANFANFHRLITSALPWRGKHRAAPASVSTHGLKAISILFTSFEPIGAELSAELHYEHSIYEGALDAPKAGPARSARPSLVHETKGEKIPHSLVLYRIAKGSSLN